MPFPIYLLGRVLVVMFTWVTAPIWIPAAFTAWVIGLAAEEVIAFKNAARHDWEADRGEK